MSLSTDVLGRATPTRLICRGGRWMLELSRLEAVDRDVFQPRLTRLEGPESILAALRRSDDAQQLVSGAAQLMRSQAREDDRAFEVSDGDWVPADVGPAAAHKPVESPEVADTARALAELRAELLVLRASHSRLRDRVIALEASHSGTAAPNLRPVRGSRSQRRRSEPPPGFAEVAPEPERMQDARGFAATQASPGLAPAAKPPTHEVRPPSLAPEPTPAEQSIDDIAKSLGGAEPPLAPLSLPKLESLAECLGTLMGTTPELERSPEVRFDTLERPFACKLLDDEGRERGAVVMDMKATLLLGAALLALPRDEALRQVRENDPSEDALLAMSEICNNLTGPVNAVSGNQHVRSTALTEVDVGSLPKPRLRLDIKVDGGVLVLAMF